VVALLAAVYLVDRLLRMPGRAVDAGREVAAELLDLAAAFHQGRVETAFASYATSLAASSRLQVATLRQVEVFTRTESSSVLWGKLQLPDVVVQARVPVEYVYYLDLDGAWRFELSGRRLTVHVPPLEFNSPALDVSRLEYDIRASSILRDEDAAIAALQAGLTELARRRARELREISRETARHQTERFVADWLSAAFDDAEDHEIEVIFADEPIPGRGAVFEKAVEGAR